LKLKSRSGTLAGRRKDGALSFISRLLRDIRKPGVDGRGDQARTFGSSLTCLFAYTENRTVIAVQALKGKELRIDARRAPSTYINQDGAQGSSSLTPFPFLPSLYPPNSPHESLFLVSNNATPHSPSDRTPSRRLSRSFPPPPKSPTPWLKAPQHR